MRSAVRGLPSPDNRLAADMALTALERAREIIEGLEERHQARLRAGNLGEWQTEVNEVYRALHAVMEHLDPPPPAYPY